MYSTVINEYTMHVICLKCGWITNYCFISKVYGWVCNKRLFKTGQHL